MSITLGAILRAVFGAEGPALDKLRDVVPPMVTLGGLHVVCAADACGVTWVRGVHGGGTCGTGAVSTLSSPR